MSTTPNVGLEEKSTQNTKQQPLAIVQWSTQCASELEEETVFKFLITCEHREHYTDYTSVRFYV